MNNCATANNNNYSARMRSRSKQPIYTSDKRAKFTQRENKKWIRLLTVLGYIFFVSLPAISLSIYYIYMWDPGYIKKFPSDTVPLNQNKSVPIHMTPILSARNARELSGEAPTEPAEPECSCNQRKESSSSTSEPFKDSTPDVARILAEGQKSMEASEERFRRAERLG